MIAHHRLAAPMLAATFVAGVGVGIVLSARSGDAPTPPPAHHEIVELAIESAPAAAATLVDAPPQVTVLPLEMQDHGLALDLALDVGDAGVAPCGGAGF